VDLFAGDFDFVSTGWIRYLPPPASDSYLAIWRLYENEDGPITGDLDDLGPGALPSRRTAASTLRTTAAITSPRIAMRMISTLRGGRSSAIRPSATACR
jgi:hypothetical protein